MCEIVTVLVLIFPGMGFEGTMTNKPFIKKFKVDGHFYIYDVNSNGLFKVDEVVHNLVDNDQSSFVNENTILKKFPAQMIEDARINLLMMKEKGYFSHHRPQITYFHTRTKEEFVKDFKELLNCKLARIVLVMSEDCNMRCKYCAYSGKYLYNRSHSETKMSPETMKKAVDFYFSRSQATPDKAISFYGGEPLLSFELIDNCIDYIKKEYPGPVRYNMTINGTLLSDERVEFLVKNNFSLLVSIDGPRDIHDRYRVFKNGKGTWDIIIENLKQMKSKYPEYYRDNVGFNMILTPHSNLKAIDEFISRPDIKVENVIFSNVMPKFTTFYEQFTPGQMTSYREMLANTLVSLNRKLVNGEEPGKIERGLNSNRYIYIHQRDMKPLPPKYPSHGQCLLGERSLLVNTDGRLNFCTQMEDVYHLGNVDSGYDFQRIEEIYFDLETFFAQKCHRCWAIRFCRKCIKDLNKNGELDETLFERLCNNKKEAILNEIIDYIKIRTRNPNAFDYINEITVS